MSRNRLSIRGFTIVELLIVIVVIGILATITVIAYNGVQARAKATAVESTVDSYRDALIQYATLNKAYPRATASFCLGEVSWYPDGCYAGSTTDSNVETELRSVLSTLPAIDTSCNTMGTECRRNLAFIYQGGATLDGNAHPYYMMYFLQNGQNCMLDGNLGGTWTQYSSTPNGTGYFEQDSNTQVTMCVISMPDPDDL